MNFLQQANIDLKETQRMIIFEILNQQYTDGIIETEEDYQNQLQDMLSKVSSAEPILRVREQNNQSNPSNFNLNFQELSIDIATIFNQINLVDSTVTKHQQLNQGIINDIKLRIRKLHDELDRVELLSLYSNSSGIILETFRDANNLETNLSYYKGISSDCLVTLDINKEAIKLPILYTESALIGPSGIKLGKLNLTKQLGSGLIHNTNPEHSIDKAIDSSFETFWSETILTDAPIKVPLTADYFNIQYGAFCELEVNFDAVTTINEISLIPFSEYPMDVVAIKVYISDKADAQAKSIIEPLYTEGTIYNSSTTEPIVFQFQDIIAKKLRIQLNQRHYIRTEYISNKQIADELDRWFNRNSIIEFKHDGVFMPTYKNRMTLNPNWIYFSEAMKDLDIKGLDKLFNSPIITKPLTKYQYSYGLYNIGINYNEYVNYGYYISKPMDIPGNIKSITIRTDEEHPIPEPYMFPITHVEYSVSPDDGINWYNIAPINQTNVNGELITTRVSNNIRKATLRFKPSDFTTIDIRCNSGSTSIPPTDYTYYPDTNEIRFSRYDISKNYTVSYTPENNSFEIDFVELCRVNTPNSIGLTEIKPHTFTERFLGTDRDGLITLSYYPYVDRLKLNKQSNNYNPSYLNGKDSTYTPLKIKIITPKGRHIEQKIDENDMSALFIENKTDYFESRNNSLDPFGPMDAAGNEIQNYQYEIVGNTVQFNTVLPIDTQIIVDYPYILKNLRIRAILRRTINNFVGLTPIVNSITVDFKSLT